LVEETLAVLSRLGPVVLLLGRIGIEEAGDRRVAGPIDMLKLAVPAHAGPPPYAERRVGAKLAGRQLQHDPQGVVGSKSVVPGPGKRIDLLELGEVFAPLP